MQNSPDSKSEAVSLALFIQLSINTPYGSIHG